MGSLMGTFYKVLFSLRVGLTFLLPRTCLLTLCCKVDSVNMFPLGIRLGPCWQLSLCLSPTSCAASQMLGKLRPSQACCEPASSLRCACGLSCPRTRGGFLSPRLISRPLPSQECLWCVLTHPSSGSMACVFTCKCF